ncbi:BTAD domain-containing putative transcriptional regulator [Nostocoides sp. F2B08]|uniref:AfsR/SARP family transcriptional regulator n=1 Tax=Nostocoides sp. F2B08 TaxID=2653936 RepID=UPI00186B52E6|nr:BTAD domain-containing putative transcriptional regulator [Tetrasphaera sp. F2B08]
MDILILGLLLVRDAERLFGPGDLGGVKPRQVLELLVLARGHAVSTEAIAAALWAEGREPHNVTATLNTYVCVLRRSLFGSCRDRARRTIVTGPGAYRLDLEGITLDVARFDDLVLAAQRSPERPHRIRLLTEAVGLYRGPLLEHARYDEWVQEERTSYEDRMTRAHLDLARDWLGEGDRLTSLRHAELALRHDRYSEEAYRLIMVANYDLGHHDAVRRALERCRTVLDRDLGVGLSPETSRLAACMQARNCTADLLERFYPQPAIRVPALAEGSVA